ncbi:unnamed protein product [Closterium sp. Naga37s-1]|nr:unnamed protein product [Closterium sp. Naga37s-1]
MSPSLPLPRRLHFPPTPSRSIPPPVAFPARRLRFSHPSPSLPPPVTLASPACRTRFPARRTRFPASHTRFPPVAFTTPPIAVHSLLPTLSPPLTLCTTLPLSSLLYTPFPPVLTPLFPPSLNPFPLLTLLPPAHSLPPCSLSSPLLTAHSLPPPYPLLPCSLSFPLLTLSPPAHSLPPCSLSPPLLTLSPPAHSLPPCSPSLHLLTLPPCSLSPPLLTLPPCSLSPPLLTLSPPAHSLSPWTHPSFPPVYSLFPFVQPFFPTLPLISPVQTPRFPLLTGFPPCSPPSPPCSPPSPPCSPPSPPCSLSFPFCSPLCPVHIQPSLICQTPSSLPVLSQNHAWTESSWAITAVSAVEMACWTARTAAAAVLRAGSFGLHSGCHTALEGQLIATSPPSPPTSIIPSGAGLHEQQQQLCSGRVADGSAGLHGGCNNAVGGARLRGWAKQQATAMGITGYDQVDFYGWLGLLLAVNVQPTIAFVRGSYPSFQTYTNGCAAAGVVDHSVASGGGCAAAGVVDHSVVVMDYSISSDGAYWIIHNSWGSKWGMQGYMQMAFGGGTGICGIHLVPAIYPVIKTDVCSMQDDNPCAVGTCINDNAGGFFCLCPTGFEQGYRPNGAHTCVPSSHLPELHCLLPNRHRLPARLPHSPTLASCLSPSIHLPRLSPPTPLPTAIYPSYTVSFPIDIDCPLVYQLYGLTEEAFLAQNLQLSIPPNTQIMEHCYTIPANKQNMEHCYTIPANTQVSVAPPLMGAVHCVLYYSWTSQDTCECVADNFWLTVDDLLALNPGINCTDSTAWNAPCVNQQLCVAKGSGGGGDLPKLPMCMNWYTVQSGDMCESIMKDYALNQTAFFLSSFPSMQLCVAKGSGGSDLPKLPMCTACPLKPRSVRELPSTSPLLPSSLSSPSSSFSPSSSSFPTRGRLLGLSTTSHPSPASMPRLPTLIPSHADQPMRGRQLAVTKRRCLAFYSVTRGDFCARIISLKFQNSARKMAELNNGYVCNNDRLYVGLSLCTRR